MDKGRIGTRAGFGTPKSAGSSRGIGGHGKRRKTRPPEWTSPDGVLMGGLCVGEFDGSGIQNRSVQVPTSGIGRHGDQGRTVAERALSEGKARLSAELEEEIATLEEFLLVEPDNEFAREKLRSERERLDQVQQVELEGGIARPTYQE